MKTQCKCKFNIINAIGYTKVRYLFEDLTIVNFANTLTLFTFGALLVKQLLNHLIPKFP